jgi:transposase-like protein
LARRADLGDLRLPSAVPTSVDVHMTILQTLVDVETTKTPKRRGPARQQRRRQLEQMVRMRAVQFTRRLLALGYSHQEAAERLGVKPRTLRHWMRACRGRLPIPTLEHATLEHATLAHATLAHATLAHATLAHATLAHATLEHATRRRQTLGRPLALSSAGQQLAVFSWLDDVGPGVGVPTLRRQFDGMARAELDALVKEYRRCWRAANRRLLHVLTWRRPGSVWAADFAQAPCLIDGRYSYLLAVRDLASGQQLLWQPVAALTAEALLAELPLLFALHGAPWVLKTDNGSAFIAEVVHWYLQRCGVHQLFSPPLTPAYNGSIEASIGSMKKRTQQHSERAGHPGQWTSTDVEAARSEANTTARPRRLNGLTPHQVWDARQPLSSDGRDLFAATVARLQIEARFERGLSIAQPLTRAEQAAVDRVAFSRALVAHDLLLFRRRAIPPQITRPKVAIEG